MRLNSVSFPLTPGVNGVGRSFTVDLNLTTSLMVTSRVTGSLSVAKKKKEKKNQFDEIAEE